MLEPTVRRAAQFLSYPPRQRWVLDAAAYRKERGAILSYPPRQRWDLDAGVYSKERDANSVIPTSSEMGS